MSPSAETPIVEPDIEYQIRQSWQRCQTAFSLQRSTSRASRYVGGRDLDRRRARLLPLMAIATAEMRRLQTQVDAPVGVALTDADGVILRYVGDAGFAPLAQRAGMLEGAIWSEAHQGTNGMGTCLAAREPVLVRAREHFLRQNTAFSCCASPIRDSLGRVIAAINVSCGHELGWVSMLSCIARAVQAIENHLLLHVARDAHVLRVHAAPECVASGGEGLIVFNGRGEVAGVSRSACEWLGLPTAPALPLRIEELLTDFDLVAFRRLALKAPWAPQPLPGTRLFGLLQLPPGSNDGQAPAVVIDPNVDDPLAAGERGVLLAVLEASRWNVALAARRLHIGRKTLYRKLHAHGIKRPDGGASDDNDADITSAGVLQ